jgi:hypothetical protein
MADDLHRDVGALEARADAQDERLRRIEAKVDALIEAVAQSKGGIRMLIALGSLGATLAGLIGAWIAKLWQGQS